MSVANDGPDRSPRRVRAEATYERLFGPRDLHEPESDPELTGILRGFIFGDVFDTGALDDQTRELITVTVLSCLQALPQLSSHTGAALNVGVTPVAIREAVYQLAPFIGFPWTLNATATINQVFTDRGISLPLPTQASVTDADRYRAGLAVQGPLYGDEIKTNLADLPAPFDEALPRFLTEFCFGDFYTREGLSLGTARTTDPLRAHSPRRHLGPTGPARPRVPAGGQQPGVDPGGPRALLPLRRLPPRHRHHPDDHDPVAANDPDHRAGRIVAPNAVAVPALAGRR